MFGRTISLFSIRFIEPRFFFLPTYFAWMFPFSVHMTPGVIARRPWFTWAGVIQVNLPRGSLSKCGLPLSHWVTFGGIRPRGQSHPFKGPAIFKMIDRDWGFADPAKLRDSKHQTAGQRERWKAKTAKNVSLRLPAFLVKRSARASSQPFALLALSDQLWPVPLRLKPQRPIAIFSTSP